MKNDILIQATEYMEYLEEEENDEGVVIAYTTIGDIRGACGHTHGSAVAAFECIRRDGTDCRGQGGYSDRHVRPIRLNEALCMARVPWALIAEAGYDLKKIEREAAIEGDYDLAKRAQRARTR